MSARPTAATRARSLAALSLAIALTVIGGVGPASAAIQTTIDAVPGTPLLTLAAGHGSLTVGGDADAGTVITVATRNLPTDAITTVCGPVTAGLDNRWMCTFTPGDDHIGQLQAYVGASSAFDLPLSIITAPAFSSASTAATGSDTTPTISGTVPAGGVSTEVTVTVNTVSACTVTVAPGAAWSCDVAAGLLTADGSYTIGASQTKDFGTGQFRTSSVTTTTYLLDAVGPTTAATFTTPASSTYTSPTASLALAGTAESGGTVSVVTGATTLCGPVAVTAGVWSCAATLPGAGTFTLSIVQKDAVGNLATVPSETVAVTLAAPPVVVPPPTIYVPAPPIPVTAPPIYIPEPVTTSPSTTILVEQDAVIWGLNEEPVRELAEEIVVNAFEAFCVSSTLSGTPGETIPVDGYVMVPCESAFVEVKTWLTFDLIREIQETKDCEGGGETSIFSGEWSMEQAIEDYGGEGAEDDFAQCTKLRLDLIIHTYPENAANGTALRFGRMIESDSVLLASGMLKTFMSELLEVELPISVPAGDADLEFVISDPDHPDAEPVVVRMPITLVDPDAPAPGFPWWAVALILLAVAAVIAVVLLVVRRVRA